MRYRRRPFWRECWPLWLGECPMFQPCQELPPMVSPKISSQVANCHEEAQALREYLAEVRKLDAGNHPKVETLPQTFGDQVGTLSVVRSSVKMGNFVIISNIDHYGESCFFWIRISTPSFWYRLRSGGGWNTTSFWFIEIFHMATGNPLAQMSSPWTPGDQKYGLYQPWKVFSNDQGVLSSNQRQWAGTQQNIDVTTWKKHKYTWSIAGVHSLCLLMIEIIVALTCCRATINLCIS